MLLLTAAGVAGVLVVGAQETRDKRTSAQGGADFSNSQSSIAGPAAQYYTRPSTSVWKASHNHVISYNAQVDSRNIVQQVYAWSQSPRWCFCLLCCCAGFAMNAALAFERQLSQMFGPLLALQAIIRYNPTYAAINATFDDIAKELLDQVQRTGRSVRTLG